MPACMGSGSGNGTVRVWMGLEVGAIFVFVFGIILLGRPSCRRHPHPPSLRQGAGAGSFRLHASSAIIIIICMPFRFPKLTLWGCSKAGRVVVKGNVVIT